MDGQARLARLVFMAALILFPLQTAAATKTAGKSASGAHVTLETGKKGPPATLGKLEDALKQARSESEARAILAQLHTVRLGKLTLLFSSLCDTGGRFRSRIAFRKRSII